MRLTVQQQDLLEGFRHVSRACAPKHVNPILSGVLLRASHKRLELCGTDLELSIRTQSPADVQAAGAIILPGRELYELVKRLPTGPLSMSTDQSNGSITLSSESAEYVIHGLAGEQFPSRTIPSGVGVTGYLPTAALLRLLRETSVAISPDPSRPWLTGVHLSCEAESINATATNGAVVAISEAPVHSGGEGSFSVTLPGRLVAELLRLLGDTHCAEVQLTITHQLLEFQLGELAISSSLLDGQYPDVRAVLPTAYPSVLTLERTRLLAACERASLLAGKGGILLEGLEDGLEVRAQAAEVGRVRERVPGSLQGAPFQIGLNPKYLLDGLRSLQSDLVFLEYVGRHKPLRLRADGAALSCYMILPLANT